MKRPFALFAIFLCLLVFNSACDQDSEDMDSEETKVVSISATALKPGASSYYDTWTFYTYPQEAYIVATAGVFTPIITAPVYLPHGAIVKELVVYYTDNDDREDHQIRVGLIGHEMETGNDHWMAAVISNGPASPDRRVLEDNTVDYAQVDNHKYAYFLEVTFHQPTANVKFHGAKIILE
jgi:hypothetical protein